MFSGYICLSPLLLLLLRLLLLLLLLLLLSLMYSLRKFHHGGDCVNNLRPPFRQHET